MTTYASPGVRVEYPHVGECIETTVTLSILVDPQRGLRATVRRWLSPTRFGPPGTVTVTVAHGHVADPKGVVVMGNWFAPPGADVVSAINAAEGLLRRVNS